MRIADDIVADMVADKEMDMVTDMALDKKKKVIIIGRHGVGLGCRQ